MKKEDRQIHFNWGFHEGARCFEERTPPMCQRFSGILIENHPDKDYAAGFAYGQQYAKDGVDTSSSALAFSVYWDDLKRQAQVRRDIRNRRQDLYVRRF